MLPSLSTYVASILQIKGVYDVQTCVSQGFEKTAHYRKNGGQKAVSEGVGTDIHCFYAEKKYHRRKAVMAATKCCYDCKTLIGP